MLLRWSIRCALLCYAAVLANDVGIWQGSRTGRRRLWTLGCGLFLVHTLAAFAVHDWRHAAALRHTAERTEALVGWRFGGGLYFNYLFALLWLGDVCWSWIAAATYVRRRPRWTCLLHVYMGFIAVNGAILFAAGPTRPIGFVVVALLLLLRLRHLPGKKKTLPT